MNMPAVTILADETQIAHFEIGACWRWCGACEGVIEHHERRDNCPRCFSPWPNGDLGTLATSSWTEAIGSISDSDYIFTEDSDA